MILTISVIILNLFLFINVCFAQDYFFSGYPTEIRVDTRNGGSEDTLWTYADLILPIYCHRESVVYGTKDFLFFLNPKITITDSSTNEENFGIGFRYLSADVLAEKGFILGTNLFYDTTSSKNDFRYQQIGVGVEFLSKWLDLRGNYYYPISDKNSIVNYNYSYEFGQRSLVQYQYSTYEEPLSGFDAEAGILVPFISDFIETRVYGGGYWYHSDLGKDVEGIKGRLEIRPSRALNLTVEVKDDDVFGTDVFVGGYVTLPFDIGNLFRGKNPFEGWKDYLRFGQGPRNLTQRMTEPVIRDIDILTVELTMEKRDSKKLYDVIFVDNSNDDDASEDGSRDHPHNTLTEAFTNSLYGEDVWLFVKKGDGTSDGYTGNYTLGDNVVLWGEGYQYLGLAGGGYPIIDGGGAGDVITLGDNNKVMGLTIQGGNRGIYGKNITTVEIRR